MINKPASEPQASVTPRWTLERHDDYCRILNAGGWVLSFHHSRGDEWVDAARAEFIVDALNAAETLAAQAGGREAARELTRKALILAKDELHEMMLAHKSGNRPRNPEFTKAAMEAVTAALAQPASAEPNDR